MSGTHSIDLLKTQKSHIDLSDKSLPTDFGMDDYVASDLLDDVLLINYADIVEGDDVGGGCIMRNGLAVPIAMVQNAWRKGVVIIAGPNVKQVKVGDIVVFPSSMGIPISNLEVEGFGKVDKGLFLNEQRIFMICKKKD
jgi:hypothetical protein